MGPILRGGSTQVRGRVVDVVDVQVVLPVPCVVRQEVTRLVVSMQVGRCLSLLIQAVRGDDHSVAPGETICINLIRFT